MKQLKKVSAFVVILLLLNIPLIAQEDWRRVTHLEMYRLSSDGKNWELLEKREVNINIVFSPDAIAVTDENNTRFVCQEKLEKNAFPKNKYVECRDESDRNCIVRVDFNRARRKYLMVETVYSNLKMIWFVDERY